MEDSVRNMIIASIVLVLAAMYGGDTLGSWFQWKKEIDWKDGDTEEYTTEFHLEEFKAEYEFDAGGLTEYEDSDDNLKMDYDDNDCGDSGDCDELYDLMQGKIQNLLYVIILAGGAALYFINEGDQEKAALASLAMGGAGLLVAGLFFLNFPEAFDDDTGAFDSELDGFDEDPSIFGDDSLTTDSDSYYGDNVGVDRTWRPGFAFLLVLLSGIIGMAAYTELKI